jgi:ERCC4-type nuclease
MLEIIVDTRESSLYTHLTDRDLDKYQEKITITQEPLDIGDIHIRYDDIFYIFERKTPADLIASIKDGRYKEQKARLLSNANIQDISYIIEGDNVIASQTYSQNKSILLGSYLHSMFRDNIRMLFTKNMTETTTLLLTIATKIIDNPDKFSKNSKQLPNNDIQYTDMLKLKQKKIENIDPQTCYIMQLAQIPHISNVIAKHIAAAYPTMQQLLDALQTQEANENKIKLLCSIDKIGKEKAKNIIKYLQLCETVKT